MPKRRKSKAKRTVHANLHISVRGVKKEQPDLSKLARALLTLAKDYGLND